MSEQTQQTEAAPQPPPEVVAAEAAPAPVQAADPAAPAEAPKKELSVWEQEQERLKTKQWIQTFTGQQFFPLLPDPKAITIEDVAHALANKCRFTGHTKRLYSVAEHSIHVSTLVPGPYALAALLHDAAEAYLPDVASPIKSRIYLRLNEKDLVEFSALEDAVLATVFTALGFPELYPLSKAAAVKRADLRMLATEKRDLMSTPPADWNLSEQPTTISVEYTWTPEEAKRRFLERFTELSKEAQGA